MIQKSITIDAWKEYRQPLDLVQYEAEGRTLNITLTNGGSPVDLTDAAVTFNMTKGTSVIYDACTVTDAAAGKASLLVTGAICDTSGTFVAFLEIVKTGDVLRTQNFDVTVKTSVDNTGAVVATSEFTALEVALALVSGHEARITTAEGDIVALEAELNGWIPAGGTLTFLSVDNPTGVIAVPSNATLKYYPGMRLMFTNDGNIIKAIITAVTATTITFLHEINPSNNQALYLMADSAITAAYYSTQKAPFSFPLDPTKWTIEVTDAILRSQPNPTQGAWYNLNAAHQITIPIGIWSVEYEVNIGGYDTAATMWDAYITLSTVNNSESDNDMTTRARAGGASGTIELGISAYRRKTITKAAKAVHYLNIKTTLPEIASIAIDGAGIKTIIRATCVYL